MKNSIWNIIKKYHWKSAFFKNCFIWFAIILIPIFIIGVSLTTLSIVVSNSKLEQSNEFFNTNAKNKFEEIISSIDEYHYFLSNDYNVSKYLLNMYKDSNDLAMTIRNINTHINTFVSSNICIESIYFYNQRNNFVTSNHFSSYFDSFFDTDWYDKNAENNKIISRQIEYKGNKYEYITIIRNIVINGSSAACVAYNINTHKMQEIFVTSENSPLIVIYSKNGDVLFSSSKELIPTKKAYVSNLPYSLYLCIDFSKHINNRTQQFITLGFWLAFIILFALDILLSYKLSINYFVLMVENIIQFQAPNQSINNNSEEKLLELNLIMNNPLYLKNSENAEKFLINQYARLKSMQIISLQNQINPHFVFNTLGLISLLDMEKNKEPTTISTITELLADILRYSIEGDTNMISFASEVEYLDKYIKIQNIKYNNKFTYIKDFDSEINNCTVIKFILQPIVENAITHGILTSQARKGFIKLIAKKEDNLLKISILNSGDKLSSQRIYEINRNINTNTLFSSKHIGLANVNNRIKLIFGESYGCRLTASDNITTVDIIMPYLNDCSSC